MFLVSGHLALIQVCGRRLCIRRKELAWWIATLNQVGSYLFLVSALAAFVNPETSSAVNEQLANWGHFWRRALLRVRRRAPNLRASPGLHHPTAVGGAGP